jgi:hypothetical protein
MGVEHAFFSPRITPPTYTIPHTQPLIYTIYNINQTIFQTTLLFYPHYILNHTQSFARY